MRLATVADRGARVAREVLYATMWRGQVVRYEATDLIPTREVPLALVSATGWFIVLGIAGYSSIEQVGVVLVGYLALLMSRALAVKAIALSLGRLREYGLRAAARSGTDVSAKPSHESVGSVVAPPVVILLCAVTLVIIGLTVTITVPAIAYLGFAPLASGFGAAGLLMLGVALIGLIAFFALPLMAFASAEVVSSELLIEWIIRIEQSEAVVSGLIFDRRPAE